MRIKWKGFLLALAICLQTACAQNVRIPDVETAGIENKIEINGRRLHSFVYGKGSPTIVLLSGFNAPQTYWNSVIDSLARHTTVVTYDRPGYGLSELGTLPLHGEQTAKDLNDLLDRLEVPKPYLVVGHSYGGKIARLFVSLYRDETGGLILEDTSHEDIVEEQRKVLDGKDLEIFEQLVSARQNMNPMTELGSQPITEEQLRKSAPLPVIPFLVLISSNRSAHPMFSKEASQKLIEVGMGLQKKLADLIPGGKWMVCEGTGHNIHVEKPEMLIKPVLEMVRTIRD